MRNLLKLRNKAVARLLNPSESASVDKRLAAALNARLRLSMETAKKKGGVKSITIRALKALAREHGAEVETIDGITAVVFKPQKGNKLILLTEDLWAWSPYLEDAKSGKVYWAPRHDTTGRDLIAGVKRMGNEMNIDVYDMLDFVNQLPG